MGEAAAGVVLAGGRSSRMGTDKAALAWAGTTLVRHTCAVLREAGLDPLVVVVSPVQAVPHLEPDVHVVRDAHEGRGPMQGLATGLAAVEARTARAFVCSTDLPFLHPAFPVRVLLPLADPEVDIALPVVDGHHEPFAAAYRTSLAPLVGGLVDAGHRKPVDLFDRVRVVRLDREALLADPGLRRSDPMLDSLVNVNEPADYLAARREQVRRSP